MIILLVEYKYQFVSIAGTLWLPEAREGSGGLLRQHGSPVMGELELLSFYHDIVSLGDRF